jgi:HAE1 family hydrophobic/amphiphilic exporter-1
MLKKILKWLVAATLIYIMVSCGGMASTRHPAPQLPGMALSSIQVSTLYAGADVSTILDSVAPPLKDSIFQYVENMEYMTYTASREGSLIITVYFKSGTNLDQSAQQISNVVSVATGQLPSPVVQSGIRVARQNDALLMAVDMYSEDTGLYDQAFLTNYAAINIIPEIRAIPGVSRLITFNEHRDSLMRICLNKGQMTASNLTLKEVLVAIPAKSVEAVTGILNKHSKQPFDYIIKCKSEHDEGVKYGNMIIRREANTVLKLKEVAAKIEFSPYTDGKFTHINGKPAVNIVVMQLADSNYNETQIAIKKLMETASKSFPTGIKHLMLYNPKDSLYISVD